MSHEAVLRISDLGLEFQGRGGKVVALEDVTLDLSPGECLGLVGESGSGKSTLLRAVVGLLTPDRGRILFGDEELPARSRMKRRALARRIQIVFQDPQASLNPRMTVAEIVGEPLRVFEPELSRAERRRKVSLLLGEVGLAPDALDRYAHSFSGGQRQRIGIARALISNPELVLLDEAVSALDVSVQAQVLNLLADLRAARGLSYLFVSHDLAVVRAVADRIAVLYLGRLVEVGPRDAILEQPRHPYTRMLRDAVPTPDPEGQRRKLAESAAHLGSPAVALRPERGCVFAPRCALAEARCREETPKREELQPDHAVACFHPVG